ncbi:hypothetical protein BH11PSE8_BH11PSE8_15100 [soil metagenome]
MPEHDALPPGTRFGEFEIIRVLGVGGFGIVYLAQDHSLEREVALKEYMPASLAARGVGPAITVRSGSFSETYAIGLRSFVNEARLLARFDHPSLVKVYRFWEDNATAYMVMPYLQGVTLRDARRAMAQPPDERWIRGVLNPMLDAIELLHREGVYHRDIAPDNILLPREGQPILLDFGAARRVISDRTQSLTAILKPSYAPIEQYAEMTQLRQGPWTDIYALGAVMHFLLFGAPPPPATARALQDTAEAIEDRVVPGVSARFLSAVAWMLAVRPGERPQSAEALRSALDGRTDLPTRPRASGSGQTTVPAVAPVAPPAFDAVSGADERPAFEATMVVSPAHAPRTAARTGASTAAATAAPSSAATPPAAIPANMPTARTTEPPGMPRADPSAPIVPSPDAVLTPPARPAVSAAQTIASHAAAPMVTAPAPATSKTGIVVATLATIAVLAVAGFWKLRGTDDAANVTVAAQRAGMPATTLPASPTATVPVPSAPGIAQPVPQATAVPPAGDAANPSTAAAMPTVTTPAPTLPPSITTPSITPQPSGGQPTPTRQASSRVGVPVPEIGAGTGPDLAVRPKPARVAAKQAVRPEADQADGDEEPPAEVTETRVLPSSSTRASIVPSPRPLPSAMAAMPATAREACGSRVFIAMALCMERQCELPRYRNQTECVRIAEAKRRREAQ